jgi:hypothetical protein
VISTDLTREDPGTPASLGVFADSDPAKGKHRGVIYSIAPSPKDVNLIWVGTDDGLIHVTRNGGRAWREVTPPELTPWSKVAQMDASHFDAGTVYAAVNRFRLDDLHPYIYRTHDSGRTWQKIVAGLPDDEPVNTVREDPERKGLLFAGTERSVYVTFDDGDHWQSLRANLPATSIRDLVVHNDDLVVGTHGRSFWILDNITPLRQLTAEVPSESAHLFAPQLTYRVRRSTNPDTPLPPEVPAGQNPPDGAMLDYTLAAAAMGPVVLEIANGSGKLIRRYSSNDQPATLNEKELNVPTYWLRPERVPATSPGMHRFVWNLRLPPPDALDHEYPISAIPADTPRGPEGPAVLPGDYKVSLIVNGKTYTQLLHVQMDPRVKTPAADLAQQFNLETQISDAIHADYVALTQIRTLRAQLKAIKPEGKLRDMEPALKDLDSKAAVLEGDGSGPTYLSTPEGTSFTKLNAGLATLLGIVDSADVAPTTQAQAMFTRLQNALADQTKQWEELQARQVTALNTSLKRARAKPLDPKSP